jgi:hypothetical protein
MPANLNALIRYKTINSCLYGGKRRYDIHELIDACSNALNEARGRGVSISERTVRDDIRVMRSEILGFNAPIVQKDGLYFYSDPKYTILSVGITDPDILDAVIKSLIRIRKEVKHPELEIVLKKLKALSPESFETAITKIKESEIKITHYHKIRQEINENIMKESVRYRFRINENDTDLNQKPMMSFSLDPGTNVSWGDLMGALLNES